MFLNELSLPVNRIKGIGAQTSKDLKNLGIINIKHLLTHFPVRYEDRLNIQPIKNGIKSGYINTKAKVIEHSYIGFGSKKTLKVIVEDKTGYISLLCFGRNFLEKKLAKGKEIYLYSNSLQYKFSELQTSSFDFEEITEEPPKEFGVLLPIYRLSGNLSQHNLRKYILQGIENYASNIDNELPDNLKDKKSFLDKRDSLKNIHFPKDNQSLEKAQKSLIYEELFHLQMVSGRKILKHSLKKRENRDLPSNLQKRLIEKLPFNLTKDQDNAINDILKDLNSNKKMNRLIQGDVGSGKTLVALLAALPVIEAGGQVALMAPTELLAKQHSEKAYELLNSIGVRTAFISGNIKNSSRDLLLTHLKQGNIDFIIGTHALFTQDVEYKNLELVIVDEQHRFGVNQRLALAEKGDTPDMLLMTATPIPRTLTMTLFGDLDVSTIKTMPMGRKRIETHLVRVGNEYKVYDFIFNELSKGRQCYFVYPLIEQSEKLQLKDAESMFKHLQEIFKGYNLGLIHSRVDEEIKESTMENFNSGKIDILVATSVVEVGVDVPNATVIVIEHAERFGLSALHQLRGRVGRGEFQSYCFLSYSNILTDEGKKRLLTMKDISDGFEISREDLKLRGPGDVAGVKQSGFMNLAIANLSRDFDTLKEARKDVFSLLNSDPGLIDDGNKNLRELYSTCPPFNDDFIAQG